MNMDRRGFLQKAAMAAGALAGLGADLEAEEPARPAKDGPLVETVRDRLWLWCHAAGAHTRSPEQYGIPGQSHITPAYAAKYLGLRNVLMVRHGNDLLPPTPECAATVASLDRVVWGIEGGGGEDVDGALGLRATLPNLEGVMMDDYFGRVIATPPMWLAANSPTFPVTLTLVFPAALAADKIELVQSQWGSGDYRSGDFVIEASADGTKWAEVAKGSMPAEAGDTVDVALKGGPFKALRVSILGTRDKAQALSCGLTRVRVFAGGKEVALDGVQASATSEYPGHPASNVLKAEPAEDTGPFSLAALKKLRDRLRAGKPLDIWVVLYTGEFNLAVLKPHIDLCDVVTMWTWKAEDLAKMDESFDRFERIVGPKRKVLGLYMWDYGTGKPMPVDAMEHQCETGLRWLREGRIDGMIFLASCICDLGLEAVEFSRKWIATKGAEKL